MSEEDDQETDWCVGTATKRGIISGTAKKAEEMGALLQWHPSSRGRAGSMLSGLYRMGKYQKDEDVMNPRHSKFVIQVRWIKGLS